MNLTEEEINERVDAIRVMMEAESESFNIELLPFTQHCEQCADTEEL